jgi:hypothetical protein
VLTQCPHGVFLLTQRIWDSKVPTHSTETG